MTLTPHGHPDWRRELARTGRRHALIVGAAMTSPVNLGRFFIGADQTLAFRLATSLRDTTVTFGYWDAQTGGNLLLTLEARVNAGPELDIPVPIMAPWIDVTLTPTGGAGGTYNAFLFSTMDRAHFPVNVGRANLIAVDAAAIAGGATVNNLATAPVVGWAVWSAFCTGAAWGAYLEQQNAAGTWVALDKVSSNVPTGQRKAYLSAYPTRIRMVNVTGVGQNFDAYLNGAPVL